MGNKFSLETLKSAAPFVLACLVVFLFGGLFAPGEWYQALRRAPWSPPDLAFPIVWSLLYLCIAIAGYHIAKAKAHSLLLLWWAQLFINGLWSWIFFGQQLTLLGLMDISILIGLLTWLMAGCWRANIRIATYLLLPYLAWLMLAASLNAYIVIYN